MTLKTKYKVIWSFLNPFSLLIKKYLEFIVLVSRNSLCVLYWPFIVILVTLRYQIDGYSRLLIFKKFSILPTVIWASLFINTQENSQTFGFFTNPNDFFSFLPAVIWTKIPVCPFIGALRVNYVTIHNILDLQLLQTNNFLPSIHLNEVLLLPENMSFSWITKWQKWLSGT